MRSRYNHSRQRKLPVKPIKANVPSNIDKSAIATWSTLDDARQDKMWEAKMLKKYGW